MLLLQRATLVCASRTWLAGTWRKSRVRSSPRKSCWRRGLLSKKLLTGSSMWWVQNVVYAGPCSQYKMLLIYSSMWWVQKVVYRSSHVARTKCQWDFSYSKHSSPCSVYKMWHIQNIDRFVLRMHVVDKKLTVPAYCVAANCNNSQMTPGIMMHELPCSRPAVRRKWITFIQFKRADFLAVMPICVVRLQWVRFRKPHGVLLRSWHDVLVLFQNPAWQAQTDTAVSLWVTRAKCQFRLRS